MKKTASILVIFLIGLFLNVAHASAPVTKDKCSYSTEKITKAESNETVYIVVDYVIKQCSSTSGRDLIAPTKLIIFEKQAPYAIVPASKLPLHYLLPPKNRYLVTSDKTLLS